MNQRNQMIGIFVLLCVQLRAQLPPACSAYGDKCLYSAGAATRFVSTPLEFSYTDAANLNRTISVHVRVPVTNQPGITALPVVVWSQAGDLWGDATAAAGYLSVSVPAVARDERQKSALCSALRVPDEECEAFDAGSWDGVNDLARVVAALETYNQSGPIEIRGRIDLARIAVAGFGEGASAAMTLAGATRLIRPAATRAVPDAIAANRPVAFIALSPPGPPHEGFYDTDTRQPTHSWMNVRKPLLSITSAGDNTCRLLGSCQSGDMSSMRTVAFQLMPAGDKYSMVVGSVEMDHDFLGSLDISDCAAKGVESTNCSNHSAWLRAVVVAFLDAKVRTVSAAATWLDNGLIRPASGNVVLWRKK